MSHMVIELSKFSNQQYMKISLVSKKNVHLPVLQIASVQIWIELKISMYQILVLFDYWIFHNRSSKIIGQEVSIDERL